MHFLFLQKIIKDKPETNKKDFIGYRIHRNGVEGSETDSKTSFGIISPMYFSFHTKYFRIDKIICKQMNMNDFKYLFNIVICLHLVLYSKSEKLQKIFERNLVG